MRRYWSKTAAAAAKSLKLCPTLCDPVVGSPPGTAVAGILQARTLEWVAISFSNAWKWKVKVKSLSRVWLFMTTWTAAYQAPPSMGFSRQEYWSGVPLPSLGQRLQNFNYAGSINLVVQVVQSCLTFCDPIYWSTPGFPVLHYLPELTQTHVHWVGDAIQPSHPLSSPSSSCLTKCGPLEKGMASHFRILALRTPRTIWINPGEVLYTSWWL